MPAGQGQLDIDLVATRLDAETLAKALLVPDGPGLCIEHTHVAVRRLTEGHHAVTRGKLFPQWQPLAVAMTDEDAIFLEAIENFRLGARNSLLGSESLEMCTAGVIEKRDIRPGHHAQVMNLAGMVGAHLDHGVALFLQPCEGQRHADVVIEIAAGREDRSHLGKDPGQHLLDSGLAVAACQRHDMGTGAATPGKRQLAESTHDISADDLWQIDIHLVINQSRDSTLFCSGSHVIVPVEVFARYRHEQGSALERTRIAADTIELGVAIDETGAEDFRDFADAETDHARISPRIASTVSRSEK